MFNYSFEFYFAKNSFNILRKKIYPNFLIKKNVQLLIRILFREKFIQYTSEKIYPNFILQKNTQIIYWFYDVTFYAKHFINRNMSREIFQFRIKIIFRNKILYQFNNSIRGSAPVV